jgi:predicted transcriptional regulator
VGRPKGSTKPFDLQLVKSLARIGCTADEIATIVGVSRATLFRRAKSEIHQGNDEMRMSLRRWQYEKAKEGSVPMLIWLGKQYLGQRDRIDETRREEVVTIEPFDLPKPRLADSA